MDVRTRRKYLRQTRLALHLFEGHFSWTRKAGKPLEDVVSDGLAAMQKLAIETVVREARATAWSKARPTPLEWLEAAICKETMATDAAGGQITHGAAGQSRRTA